MYRMMTFLCTPNVLLLILLFRIAEADPFGQLGFSFNIPYDQTQECDIYGALCQTGSITVGFNVTSTTSTTVLPCSSYLTAQSSFLGSVSDVNPSVPDGINWRTNFGRSPECHSYAQAFSRGQYTASNCGSGHSSVYPIASGGYPVQVPPGVNGWLDFEAGETYTCCGNCSLEIEEVRLYYFPDGTTTECHHNQTSNSSSDLSPGNLGKRMQSLVGDGSIAIVSGHTFTSPSLYLQVLGAATVTDQCGGTIGSVLTNPIVTLAPGQLSTWRPPPPGQFGWDNFTVGEAWTDWSTVYAFGSPGNLFPLDVKDLECPTWGLGRSTSADGTVITTIGPPFLPLIGPMMQALTLDPSWSAACTAFLTNRFKPMTFAIFDPPTALTPGGALVPAPNQNSVTTPHPSDAGPTTTADPQVIRPIEVASPASSPVLAPALPTNSESLKKTSIGDPPSPSLPDPSISHDDPSDGTPLGSLVAEPNAQPLNSALAFARTHIAGSGTALRPNPSDPESATYDIDGLSLQVEPQSSLAIIDGVTVLISLEPGGKTLGIGTSRFAMPTAADPNAPQSVDSDTVLGDPQAPVVSTTASAATTEQKGASSAQQSQGAGAIIYNALGRSEGGATDSTNRISTLTILSSGDQDVNIPGGNQVMSIQPSDIALDGTTYSAGGPVMTLSDSIFTIIPQPKPLDSASAANNDPKNNRPPDSDPLTIAGQPIVINPSIPTPNNAIISPNDAVQTLAGTIMSQQQSAASVTEISGPSLPPVVLHPNPATGNPVSAAGVTPTPAISALSVAGTTISAGGPAITAHGTFISLQPSGTLIMGSSTVDLLTAGSGTALLPDPTDPESIDGLGVQAQAQSSFVVVDGVTVLISLESGGGTLGIGAGRFAMPTAALGGNGTAAASGVQAFTGGQGRRFEVPSVLMAGMVGLGCLMVGM